MRFGLCLFLAVAMAFPASGQEKTAADLGDHVEEVQVYGNACEKIISGESKSSTRVRATDKAAFLGIKNLNQLENARKVLNGHDLNVLVYRLVDEYLEDISVQTVKDAEDKICVEVKGWISPQYISEAEKEFFKDDVPVKEAAPEIVVRVAEEVKEEVAVKPDNPENLALVHIKDLEYFNGAKSAKFNGLLQKLFSENAYFYLTGDGEIADYVISPKLLKAKVDTLDAAHKRLQMVVSLEISGLGPEAASAYQNRFVLFGTEEDEQGLAARLIRKLIENASAEAIRKIEHAEQVKLEKRTIGRSFSE